MRGTGLLSIWIDCACQDDKIDMMLEVADDGIGERLKMFEKEQATGEKLNELTERYYQKFPRPWGEAWPQPKYSLDKRLREVLFTHAEATPAEIMQVAAEFSIELSR